VGETSVHFALARNRKALAERQIAPRHWCILWHRHDALRLLLILALLFAPHATSAQDSVPAEYRTKASFLAAVPSFIDWPESAFTSAEAPFLVCVLGDFRFGTVLAELVRTASPHARHIDIRWARKDQELKTCHLLFVSNSEAKRYAKILKIVQGAGILTVGETPDFLSAGGMLSFSFQNDLLRFEVNLVAANEAHLRVSSKLLALARRVVSERDHRKDGGSAKRIRTTAFPADFAGRSIDSRFIDSSPRRRVLGKLHGDSRDPCRRQIPSRPGFLAQRRESTSTPIPGDSLHQEIS
jgi:hypothetical protein